MLSHCLIYAQNLKFSKSAHKRQSQTKWAHARACQVPGMPSGSFRQKNAQSSSVKQSPSLNAKGKEEIGKKSIWSYEKEEERKKVKKSRNQNSPKAFGELIKKSVFQVLAPKNSKFLQFVELLDGNENLVLLQQFVDVNILFEQRQDAVEKHHFVEPQKKNLKKNIYFDHRFSIFCPYFTNKLTSLKCTKTQFFEFVAQMGH